MVERFLGWSFYLIILIPFSLDCVRRKSMLVTLGTSRINTGFAVLLKKIEPQEWTRSVNCTNLIYSLSSFRFSLIHKTGTPCTAISFCLRRKNEVLVALADNSLRCYDIGRYWTAYSTHARKKWRSAFSHTCQWTVEHQRAVHQGQWASFSWW